MKSKRFRSAALLAFGTLSVGGMFGQVPPPTPPSPLPDVVYANVFYGAVNPAMSNFNTPVLIFVPGLHGVASDWFQNNDMYAYAYQAGYRTAFVSPDPNNLPSNANISVNAALLKTLIPRIATYYNTNQLYLIGHSKGGLDLQAAMQDATVAPLVKGIFAISTPNQGTQLADWAFANPSVAGPLNLLSPAVAAMEIGNVAAFRAANDTIFTKYLSKPFFTWTGDVFWSNSLTKITGGILVSLVPIIDRNSTNDGLVTVLNSELSPEFANDLGAIPTDHLATDTGTNSFPKLFGRIEALQTQTDEFRRIAVNGFSRSGGSAHNTWAWSMKWFKGKLYVGTGREELCLTLLTSDVRTATQSYPAAVKGNQCPDQLTLAQSLAAEIWEYTPATNTWRLAFQSPQNVPVTVNGQNILTALDVGYRGMEVVNESDGTQALYVGTVTSGGAYEPSPFQPNGWPPPRILRTVDGQTWRPLLQDPGTVLGEIGNTFLNTTSKVRSFRSLKAYNGRLFATAGGYEGSGIILASANPSAGGNAWSQVSPPWTAFPVWDMQVFNNYLYVTTGFTRQENANATGYALYKTNAAGSPPYTFSPIVINGGYQTDPNLLAPNGLSLYVFRNALYLGTNRPTELIRVRADDTWDLMVGEPRNTPSGLKAPLTGMGNGFGNWSNGHFWRMAAQTGPGGQGQNASGQNLFVGTWDWSIGLQQFDSLTKFDKYFTHQYGTDVYRTEDGIHWSVVTQAGFGDPNNSGTRSLEPSPVGLFLGTARQKYGLEVFARTRASTNPLPAPRRLRAVSASVSGQTVILNWDPPPNVAKFNVYRATVIPASQIAAAPTVAVPCPAGTTAPQCAAVEISAATANPFASFPGPYKFVSQTTSPTYTEPAPTTMQSLYYVRAVDANGKLSDPSNIAGAPSKSAPISEIACDIDGNGSVDQNDIDLIAEAINTPVFGSTDPRDPNHDGQINALDRSFCIAKCTAPGCTLQ